MKLTETKIEPGTVIPFTGHTERYGVAEFFLCFTYKRGKLRQLVITPVRQPDQNTMWILDLAATNRQGYHLFSYTHKGLTEPWSWVFGWCKDHNGPLVRLYAPRDANRLRVDYDGITFDVERAEAGA